MQKKKIQEEEKEELIPNKVPDDKAKKPVDKKAGPLRHHLEHHLANQIQNVHATEEGPDKATPGEQQGQKHRAHTLAALHGHLGNNRLVQALQNAPAKDHLEKPKDEKE